jgi:cysteinyl-tRNA synthetase, unknown class
MKFIASLFFVLFFTLSCQFPEGNISPQKITYQNEMQNLIKDISKNAKAIKSNFLIIPQNGLDLLKTKGNPNENYLKAIDAIAFEGLYYGYQAIDQLNTEANKKYFDSFLNKAYIGSKPIFNTDFCYSDDKINNSLALNLANNNKLFISVSKNTNIIPNPNFKILGENKSNITKIEEAKNFMLLTDYSSTSKDEIIFNIAKTNYDVIIINGFFKNDFFAEADLIKLKVKNNGGKRLVIAMLNVSVADSKNYYWAPYRNIKTPAFINKSIGLTETYTVKYWDKEWQNIISGNENSIINKYLKTGFDGAYLTGTEAYQFFE